LESGDLLDTIKQYKRMKTFFHRIAKPVFYKVFLSLILIQALLVPFAFAQGIPQPTDGIPQPSGGSGGGGTGFNFANPLGSGSLAGFIDSLLGLLIRLAVPVIALFIIWAGFLFVSARGNETQLTKAKKTLWYTLLGAAVILGAQVISGIITSTLLSL
jgi:hypothetical protein